MAVGYLTDITMTDPDSPSPRASMILVFSTSSIPEGLLVKGLLESEGITVASKGESEGPYRIGPVFLWVPEALEARARLIIEEATAGDKTEAEEDEGPSASSTGEPSEPS
jgi:putative signal transducing protein